MSCRALWFDSGQETKDFPLSGAGRQALEPTQAPIQWAPVENLPGVKRPDHGFDHSPTSSAEVKEELSRNSNTSRVFMAWTETTLQSLLL